VLLLVSGATTTVRRYAASGGIGHLLTPANGNRVEALLADGLPFAADNGCYRGLDIRAFRAMCRRLRPHAERVLWVVAPDVVANAYATLVRFWLWRPLLTAYGLPVAYVAQDGQEGLPMPWEQIRCLFVGGSTVWKEGPHARALFREAKRRGLWVHVGRVSTQRRMRLFAWAGVDSIDSTAFSRWPDRHIPPALAVLRNVQLALPDLL
jgi:hypothetical protein